MILPLLAAATIGGAALPPTAERTPNLYHQPSYCGPVVEAEVARQQVALKGRLVGGLQYAVFRELNGCSVPTPVGYHPSLEPGAADPAAKREDAPSNRR
ncbi:hypothetical protein [Phenylobacterium sp.]|jgi:hypothetical protein|uniref:hypothetical protein n=1 Tax=Phenylobacterium sp. TaxID=1871053 RepID=UPI002E36842B|nr:hypothetical protein [Phenylobacterium sp.]HEX3366137.1 hypothetical protein [Phenylobacterium sp.]